MPLGAPAATFTVGALVGGFDVLTDGYGGRREADATTKRVPYSPTNMVVVQTSGVQPSTRTYRALTYNVTDYELLAGMVGLTGSLVVGAPVIRQAAATVFFNSIELSGIKGDGSVECLLNFTVLG